MKSQPTTTEKQAHRSMEGLRVAGQVVVHDHKAKQLYGAVQQRIDLTKNRQVLKEKGNNELGVYGAVDHEEDGEQLAVEAVVLGKVAHHFDQVLPKSVKVNTDKLSAVLKEDSAGCELLQLDDQHVQLHVAESDQIGEGEGVGEEAVEKEGAVQRKAEQIEKPMGISLRDETLKEDVSK